MSNFKYAYPDSVVMAIEEMVVKKCICERCGHEWITRSKEAPRVCPKCKSPYWDKPRKKT